MLELANGSGAAVADQEMSRNEMLDREASALASGDPMELEALGRSYLDAVERKKQRRSNASSSTGDVMQVEIPPFCCDRRMPEKRFL